MSEVVENGIETIELAEDAIIQNEQFEIPMDTPIEEFGYHLKSHPRTILSAKFGDGKSFFLSKFEEVKKDDCLIITLHPVNYQVVENKDVFELIKRDILFQIMANKMLDENLKISDLTAWVFYIQNNFMGVTESLTSFIPLLQPSPKVVTGVLAALKGLKVFQDLREKVMKIKKKYKSMDVLESFLNECEDISALEEDLVTKIIQDSIDDYHAKFPNKRIVLVIEDMDRLDPAHLFRILNVFSAHLDTNERQFVKAESFRLSNKFHFDNVVFVMDFDNTRNIFKHFYGADTNFEGYIEKFVTKGVFNYSLKDEKYEYLINRITTIVNLPKEYVEEVIQPHYFEGKSIRAIVNSIENTDSYIVKHPVFYFNEKVKKTIHFGVIKLLIILKNIGIDGVEIIRGYKTLLRQGNIDVFKFFIGILYDYWVNTRFDQMHYLSKTWDPKYPVRIFCSGIDFENSFHEIIIKGYDKRTKCLNYEKHDLPYSYKALVDIGRKNAGSILEECKEHLFDDFIKILNAYITD